MKVSSHAFNNNEQIPEKYTCDGEYMNPPLLFSDIPQNAKSLALIVEDPDAPVGLWIHCMVWNIPVNVSEIPEGNINFGVIGKNSSGNNSWDDICPPDREHRYFFKLFALDSEIILDPSISTRENFYNAMNNHIIEKSELMGRYKRI